MCFLTPNQQSYDANHGIPFHNCKNQSLIITNDEYQLFIFDKTKVLRDLNYNLQWNNSLYHVRSNRNMG